MQYSWIDACLIQVTIAVIQGLICGIEECLFVYGVVQVYFRNVKVKKVVFITGLYVEPYLFI